MLSVVGHPAAVNPDKRLSLLAKAYAWPSFDSPRDLTGLATPTMNHPCLVTLERDSAPRTLFSGDRLVEVDLPAGTRASTRSRRSSR